MEDTDAGHPHRRRARGSWVPSGPAVSEPAGSPFDGAPAPSSSRGLRRRALVAVAVATTGALLIAGWGWRDRQPGAGAHLAGVAVTSGQPVPAPAPAGPGAREAGGAGSPAGPGNRFGVAALRSPVRPGRPQAPGGPVMPSPAAQAGPARPAAAAPPPVSRPTARATAPPSRLAGATAQPSLPGAMRPPSGSGGTATSSSVRPAPRSVASPCAATIADVESRGLYPAPGFTVTCPGFALGHEGMTCYHVTGICPGAKEIVVADVQAFVVANEFENSRIFMGLPVRCRVLDCGHAAYGY